MNVTELIERLRRLFRTLLGEQGVGPISLACLARDAADALEAQAREIERLRDIIGAGTAAAYEETMAGLQSRLATAERDAERWKHCVAHGFPVRNQTLTSGRSWIAFVVYCSTHIAHFGNDPAEAVDAAIDAFLDKLGDKP